jgi:DNA (cytosine-5)-methyltransferase 1
MPVELSAAQVGARHRRPRIFVLAHSDQQGEPLRTIYAALAGICADARRTRGAWGDAFRGPVRVAHGLPERLAVGAAGNAVVPQVAEVLGRAIAAAL